MLKVLLQRCDSLLIGIATLVVLCFIVLGFRISIITSSSMAPAISEYSICLLQKTNIEDIEVGDIISYRFMDTSITHRVTKVVEEDDNTYLYTKGDNNTLEDNVKISGSNLIGKVVYINNLVSPIISLYSVKHITTESVFIAGVSTVFILVILFFAIEFTVMAIKAIIVYVILYTDSLRHNCDNSSVVYRVKFLNMGIGGRFRSIAQAMFSGNDCRIDTIMGYVRKSLT